MLVRLLQTLANIENNLKAFSKLSKHLSFYTFRLSPLLRNVEKQHIERTHECILPFSNIEREKVVQNDMIFIWNIYIFLSLIRRGLHNMN